MTAPGVGEKVAIIGTGLVGSGWAIVFARSGCRVSLFDNAAGAAERAQRITASTTEHRVWDDALIARLEAQRREELPAEDLAVRRAWRNRRLMALAQHLQALRDEETGAGARR